MRRSGGTVYPRKDRPGLWIHEVMVGGKSTKTAYQSKEAADAAKAALLRGDSMEAQRHTLGEWLTHWVAAIAPGRVSARTARYYASIVRNQWLKSAPASLPLRA
ncbi:MAG TPA: hypothetical protein VGK16_06785, partial [Candidatus Limnocylindrales bacterium]